MSAKNAANTTTTAKKRQNMAAKPAIATIAANAATDGAIVQLKRRFF